MKNKGVTLVEVMISLVVLLIVFMGLVQASLVSIQSNMRNVIRDEAVRITSDRMTRLRTIDFADDLLADTDGDFVEDDLDPDTADDQPVVSRQIRSATVDFTINRSIANIDDDYKQISLRTSWEWQGETFSHTIAAVRGR